MTYECLARNCAVAMALILCSAAPVFSTPQVSFAPDNFSNTLVVAGESITQTMVMTNVGNSDINFSFCPMALVEIPANKDTFITEHDGYGGAFSTHGTNVLRLVHAIPGLHRTYPAISFDLTSLAGKSIKGSTVDFVIYIRSGWGWNHVSQSVSVCESLVDWEEMSASYANFGGDGFNETIHVGPTLITQTVTYNGETEPVIFKIPSSVVQRWIDEPESNKGIFLISRTTATCRDMSFWSRETGPAPQLTFELDEGEDTGGLVTHYPFNGNADDASGNGHDGTVYGAMLTEDRFGNPDSAYVFDGSDDFIEVPDNRDLRLANTSFSISSWFYETERNASYHNAMVTKRGLSNTNGWFLSVSGDASSVGAGKLFYQVSAGYNPYAASSEQISLNAWNHSVITYDLESKTLKLYINSSFDSEFANIPSPNPVTDSSMYIGLDSALKTYGFHGAIDDLRIYDRVLSAEEIAALYAETDGDGMIAHFPFNGNANDESGNGYDGTVYGATLTEDRFGNTNDAYCFDGNDYITYGDVLDINDDNFSVSLWVKASDFDQYGKLINKGRTTFGTPANAGYSLRLLGGKRAEKTLAFELGDDNGHSLGAGYPFAQLATDEHLHVVGVLERGQSSSLARLYVNGNLVAEEEGALGHIDTDISLAVGALYRDGLWAVTEGFNGDIDDVRIYNRALSSAEISYLYTERDGDGLVAHYPFNGNAADESGNGHDGMVYGATLTDDRFGNPDGAYAFDGVDDYIDLGTMGGFKTVSLWVMQDVREEYEFYFGHPGFKLFASVAERGKLTLLDGGAWFRASIQMDDHVGGWNHVVGISDGVRSKLYFNGVDVTTANGSGVMSAVPDGMVNLGRWLEDTFYFHGSLDDIRVFDRVLSESEIEVLYSEGDMPNCSIPDWLAVEPASGVISPGTSVELSFTFIATNLVAGDYASHTLDLYRTDSADPIGSVPVSMWIVPQAPVMAAEPECSEGKVNEVFWSQLEGPVEYWVEGIATEHCSPGRNGCSTHFESRSVPSGWLNQKRFGNQRDGFKLESGWVTATNHVFTDLRLNTKYQYRVKASVMSEIGRLEGDWSEAVVSCQIPHVNNGHKVCIPDWWKNKHFAHGGRCSDLEDSDGDGHCNLDEYISGNNPRDRKSTFKVKGRKRQDRDEYVVEWDSVPGRVYRVYWCESLADDFQLIADEIRYPQSSFPDADYNAKAGGFYKVEVALDE